MSHKNKGYRRSNEIRSWLQTEDTENGFLNICKEILVATHFTLIERCTPTKGTSAGVHTTAHHRSADQWEWALDRHHEMNGQKVTRLRDSVPGKDHQ